jgi:flagellar P-ring protein precursor FlgI
MQRVFSRMAFDFRMRFGAWMRRRVWVVLAFLLLLIISSAPAGATARIKDIADFEGVRDNVLIGYGLVVGLNGTGDTLRNSVFTQESLVAMLERLGVNTRGSNLNTQNVAAVMVTSSLPAFARQGSRIDATVSTLGDADSLIGGTLLVTPLLGADGEAYAVAQGQIAVGGFTAGGNAETVTKGVPTSGRLPGGVIIEREVPFELDQMSTVRIALRNPDLTTADRIAAAINGLYGGVNARATDPGTVTMPVPSAYFGRVARLMTEIEQLRIEPDQPARIVIDESNGIIVMGENVRISKVAVSQGNLTVRITEQPEVSQPEPFAEGETAIVDRTQVAVDEQDNRKMAVLSKAATLDDLVEGLNALGVGPRDMISIIQAIKTAGALQAELEVM